MSARDYIRSLQAKAGVTDQRAYDFCDAQTIDALNARQKVGVARAGIDAVLRMTMFEIAETAIEETKTNVLRSAASLGVRFGRHLHWHHQSQVWPTAQAAGIMSRRLHNASKNWVDPRGVLRTPVEITGSCKHH